MSKWERICFAVFTAALAFALGTGCLGKWSKPTTALHAGYNPYEIRDIQGEVDAENQLDMKDLFAVAEKLRKERKPDGPVREKNILVLSGGGVYGAYCAGGLVGWTESGTRPSFDVVTGISTGALIAPFAFLGPELDCKLKNLYITLRSRDVFRIKKTIRSLFSDALADSSPLEKQIEEQATPDLLRAIAAEHAKGRRLYVGTTELETRRSVIWDMGEIATRGTMEDLILFRKIILASAAIPGLFPPVRLKLNVDGVCLDEFHIDGGVTNSMFFRPPHVPQEQLKDPLARSLYGSNLYIFVAGKLYLDPTAADLSAFIIAANSVSSLIYSQTRADTTRLYTASILTGMNYNLSAIPPQLSVPKTGADFDPTESQKMFDEGFRLGREGKLFRKTPPGLERSEAPFFRTGTELSIVPQQEPFPYIVGAPRKFTKPNIMEAMRRRNAAVK